MNAGVVVANLRHAVDGGQLAALPNQSLRLLVAVAVKYANTEGLFWPGEAELMKATGLSPRMIKSGRRYLRDLGIFELVERANGHGRTAKWKLCLESLQVRPVAPADIQQVQPVAPCRCGPSHLAGAARRPKMNRSQRTDPGNRRPTPTRIRSVPETGKLKEPRTEGTGVFHQAGFGSVRAVRDRQRSVFVMRVGEALGLPPGKLNGEVRQLTAVWRAIAGSAGDVEEKLAASVEIAAEKRDAGMRSPIAAWMAAMQRQYPELRRGK